MQDCEQILRTPKMGSRDDTQVARTPLWATVNGVKGDHTRVEINEDGVPTTPAQENVDREAEIQFEEDVDIPRQPNGPGNQDLGAAELHIRKITIQKYGNSKDCPACRRM